MDSRLTPYKKNLSTFLKNLNYITSFKKDSIFIDKKTPRLYRVKKEILNQQGDNLKASSRLINDYLNLGRWGYLPAYKKTSQYKSYSPAVLSLRISEECNLACSYCYNKNNMLNKKGVKYMPKDIAQDSVDFFLSNFKNKDMTVVFYGGEPLLNFATIRYTISYLKDKLNHNPNFKIVTNGTVMNKEILKTIINNNISVMVSLDLPPSAHKQNRRFKNGKSSFQLTKTNIKLLAKYIPQRLLIRCIIASDSNFDLKKIYKSFRDIGVPVNNFVVETQSPSCIADKIKKTRIERQRKITISAQRKKIINNLNPSLYAKEITGRFLPVIINGREPLLRCIAASKGISVNPLGEIYFCDVVANQEEFYLGNISKGMNLKKLDKIKRKYLYLPRECRACWVGSFCSQFCPLIRRKKEFLKFNCRQQKNEFLNELKFFLNNQDCKIEKIIINNISSLKDENYATLQLTNLKICLNTYRMLNRINKYIKPINIFPY